MTNTMRKRTKHTLLFAGLKLALLIAITIAVLVIDTAIFTWVLLAVVLIGICFSHASLKSFLMLLRASVFILLIAFLANVVILDGSGSVSIFGTLGFSLDGFERAGLTISRILVLLFSLFWLGSTFTPEEISRTVQAVMHPLGAKGTRTRALAQTISLFILFLPLCLTELETIHAAQLLRGAALSSRRPLARLRAFSTTFIALLVLLFKRADMRALALRSRGFDYDVVTS